MLLEKALCGVQVSQLALIPVLCLSSHEAVAVRKHNLFRILLFFIFFYEIRHHRSFKPLSSFFYWQMVKVTVTQSTQMIVSLSQPGSQMGTQFFSFLLNINRFLSLFEQFLPALERFVRIRKYITRPEHRAAALKVILHRWVRPLRLLTIFFHKVEQGLHI